MPGARADGVVAPAGGGPAKIAEHTCDYHVTFRKAGYFARTLCYLSRMKSVRLPTLAARATSAQTGTAQECNTEPALRAATQEHPWPGSVARLPPTCATLSDAAPLTCAAL